MITRILIPLLLLSALVVGLAACDDDGDGGANGAEPTATAVPDGEEPEPTEMAAEGTGDGVTDEDGDGSATVTVDGVTTELDVDECMPPEGDGPIAVVATNDGEEAELSLAGIAGAVTANFERAGELWFAVGAILEIDGSTFSYAGPALKDGGDPPNAEMAFEVTC